MSTTPDNTEREGAGGPSPSGPLSRWLARIESGHPVGIDLGLERVGRVAARAGLDRPDAPIVIVAGTNGKGSTVAMLEAAYRACGHRTGAYTSPHLVRFNERVRIDGVEADDASLVRAFEAIEPHVAPDTLTYFEWATLAAMSAFLHARCDVLLLEVGLGGRLDATNLWDADCAVLTSVALDHADWLGTDLGVIATEKAAVGRSGRPLIVGETDPPATLAPFAAARGIELVRASDADVPASMRLAGEHQRRNAACALGVLEALSDRLPVDKRAALAAIAGARVRARLERRRIDGLDVWFDVAHNPAGAAAVAHALAEPGGGAPLHLVFAALGDKDLTGIAAALAPVAASVACAGLEHFRAADAAAQADVWRSALELARGPGIEVDACADIAAAWASAAARARADGRPVLVAGSFVTVGAALELLEPHAPDIR